MALPTIPGIIVGNGHYAEYKPEPVPAAARVLTIRFARCDDLPTLPDIERQAGEAFRTLGMDTVTDDDPLSAQLLAEYQQAGRAWVAEDDNRVVGYLLLDIVAAQAAASRSRTIGMRRCPA